MEKVIIVSYHFDVSKCTPYGGKWGNIDDTLGKIYMPGAANNYFELENENEKFKVYLLHYEKTGFGSDDRKKIVEKIRGILNENIDKNILILLHGNEEPWNIEDKKEFEKSDRVIVKIFKYGTGDEYKYLIKHPDCIYDNLKAEGLSFLWKMSQKKKYKEITSIILYSLLSLHLAIQAFFGIGKDEKGRFIKIGNKTEIDKELKGYMQKINEQRKSIMQGNGNISDEYKESFPNLKAFMLVPEAQFDFFAEIGRLLVPSNNPTLNKTIDEQPMLKIIEKMFEDNQILNYSDFKDQTDTKINGKILKQKIEAVFAEKEGESLRTLCAILSNISDDGINERLLKKMSEDEVKVHKNRVKTSQNVLFEYNNCKQWLNKDHQHTKWPKDLMGAGIEPDDSYRNLIKQLIEWNKDGEPAKTVIEQIETIAFYLEQIENFIENEAS